MKKVVHIKQNIAKQFYTFFYGSFIAAILGFLVTVIATRILEPSELGMASLVILIINLSAIFVSFGTDRAFIRFFHEEPEDKRGGLLYQSLKIPLLMIFVFAFIILVFHKYISTYIIKEESLTIAIVIIIGVISQTLYRYGIITIRMKQKGNTYSIVRILEKLSLIIFLLMFYFLFSESYKIFVYATLLSFFLTALITIFLERNMWNIRNFQKKGLIYSQKQILVYSLPLLLTTMLNWVFESFDKLAINQWSTLEELGLYTAHKE